MRIEERRGFDISWGIPPNGAIEVNAKPSKVGEGLQSLDVGLYLLLAGSESGREWNKGACISASGMPFVCAAQLHGQNDAKESIQRALRIIDCWVRRRRCWVLGHLP